MSFYQKFKKNYWKRKVFNQKNDFDLRLLQQKKVPLKQAKYLFKKYVELVCLELSYYCNRSCNYCPVNLMERSDKNLEIPEKIFKSVLKSLKQIDYEQRISLNLFNEPLYSKNIFKNISSIHAYLPKAILSLNSNGDYIKNLDYLKNLEKSGLKEILITMHTPKNKTWNSDYSLNQLKKFAKKINYNLTKTNIKKLQFSLFVGKLFVEVFCTNWDNMGNSRGNLLNQFKNKKRYLPCEKPMREFVISYDGTVQLCCHIYHNKTYDKTIANLEKENIFTIYAGKILSKARRELFDFSEKKGLCSTCNHYDDNIKQKAKFFYSMKDKKRMNLILKKL